MGCLAIQPLFSRSRSLVEGMVPAHYVDITGKLGAGKGKGKSRLYYDVYGCVALCLYIYIFACIYCHTIASIAKGSTVISICRLANGNFWN